MLDYKMIQPRVIESVDKHSKYVVLLTHKKHSQLTPDPAFQKSRFFDRREFRHREFRLRCDTTVDT